VKTPLEVKTAPKVRIQPQVGVFGRIPRAGAVKTRLARQHDPEWVAGLYRAFLADTLERCAEAAPDGLWLFLAPGESQAPDLLVTLVPVERTRLQEGDTLGERIARALDVMLAKGPALVVGSDAPDLPVSLLDDALRALSDCDLVLGPTADGGYYLIGARAPLGNLLDGITWSTSSVFEETRARADARGWKVRVLASWQDVDEPSDLEALRERMGRAIAAGEAVPPRTAEWLRDS
jgi:rSAM/selenodomain-associated transferase 1